MATDPRLDRIVQFDERSRAFPVRTLVAQLKPRGYTWHCERTLDQGNEGSCVGFSIAHELIARPKVNLVDAVFARRLYHRAQELDDQPGENYEGTSVLAGMKAATGFGYYGTYRWAFSTDDLVLAVGYRGPAVLGINWRAGMMNTDSDGFIHATGDVVGGHAILCHSVSPGKGYVTLHNSWGSSWGRGGDAKVTIEDLDSLLQDQGEACIPEVRR